MADSWFAAWRSLFRPDHHLSMGRPCCPRFAWLDLCQMGTLEERDVSWGHELIHLQPGELVVSVRTLADRWRWSKSAVSRFLGTLENRDSLEKVRGTPAGTVYRVVNAEDRWPGWDTKRDSTRTPSGTGEGQEADKNKKLEEVKDTVPKKRAKKKHQLPDDWTPNETHQRIAKEERVSLIREAEKFRTHATANARRLVDWDAGFCNWLRNAAEFGSSTTSNGTSSHHGGPYIPGLGR